MKCQVFNCSEFLTKKLYSHSHKTKKTDEIKAIIIIINDKHQQRNSNSSGDNEGQASALNLRLRKSYDGSSCLILVLCIPNNKRLTFESNNCYIY